MSQIGLATRWRARRAAKRRSGVMRRRAFELCLWGLGLGYAMASESAAAALSACTAEGAKPGIVASVNDRLELAIESGETLKLAGIDPPRPTPTDPDLDSKTRDRLADWIVGQPILFHPLAERPDRWGRVLALVFAPAEAPGSAVLSVAQALLDAGLGRFAPEPEARACRAAFLAAESAARAAALGVWGDPYYAIIAAADRESFAEKAATLVIVEGRVTHVDAGARIKLFFGPRRNWDFSVTILPRNVKKFDAAGLNLAGLAGRMVRVRGLLDAEPAPQVEISSPDEIELVPQDQGQAADAPARSRR